MLKTYYAVLIGLVLTVLGAAASGEGPASAITPEMIDWEHTVAVPGGSAGQAEKESILAAVNARPQAGWFRPWSTDSTQQKARYLRLAFTQPVEAGTLIGGAGEVSILKPDAAYPGDLSNEEHWQRIGSGGARAFTLEAGTRIRAIRLASVLKDTPRRGSRFGCSHLLLLKKRYYSPLLNGAHSKKEGTATQPETHFYFWDDPVALDALVIFQQRCGRIKVEALAKGFKQHPIIATGWDWKDLTQTRGEFNSARIIGLRKRPETRALKLVVENPFRQYQFQFALPLVALGDRPAPAAKRPEMPEPFYVKADLPRDGFLAARLEDENGRRVRNLIAETEVKKGPNRIVWDLKNDAGTFVRPGTYRWKAILRDPIKLYYETTVYNGGDPAWFAPIPSRGGWLADHCAPQSAAAVGEKTFIGTYLAESGHALIAVDTEGNKLWGIHAFGAWMGAPELAANDRRLYIASVGQGRSTTIFELDPETYEHRRIHEQVYRVDIPGGIIGMTADAERLYVAYAGRAAPWLRCGLDASNIDLLKCMPPITEGKEPDHPQSYSKREAILSALRVGLPQNHQSRWTGMPAGGAEADMLLVFKEPQNVGTVILPHGNVSISALKPGKALPSGPKLGKAQAPLGGGFEDEFAEIKETVDSGDTGDWASFKTRTGGAATVLTAPEGMKTRALKFTFSGPPGGKWTPSLRWMMLMKKRFTDVAGGAEFSSPDGRASDGGRLLARTRSDITEHNPVVGVLQWREPVTLRGAGLIGLTAGRAAVDVFEGDANESPAKLAERDDVWREIRAFSPYVTGKALAQCLQPDVYVDFGDSIRVRAIRVRLLEGIRGRDADPRFAGMAGIVAFKHLGGDAAEPPSLHRRITVLELPTDAKGEAKVVARVPVDVSGDIALAPEGGLYAVSREKVARVEIEGETARLTPVAAEPLDRPVGLAFDAKGNLYVSDYGTHNVKVFSPEGKLLRTIGKAGGRKLGPYDPERMIAPRRMAINGAGQLWIAESTHQPKRVSAWSLDGKLLRWKFGPTQYGGGGWMDPKDRTVIRYRGMEFKIDWETGKSRLANMIYASGEPGTVHAGRVERTIHYRGREYVVADIGRQQSPVCLVTIYDAERGLCRPVAAAGPASEWHDFRKPELVRSFKTVNLKRHGFLWLDGNGDGEAQAKEVQLTKPGTELTGGYWGSRVGDDLALCFKGYVLPPRGFKPDGAPVYNLQDLRRFPCDISWRTADGRTFVLGNTLYDAAGKALWHYRDEYLSVHGSHRAPRPRPAGMLVGEHAVVGHFQIGGEELWVTNANHGDWFAFTRDGILAATIFGGPRGYGLRHWRFPKAERGMDISDLRLAEEHFFGSITRAEDGQVYAVAGHNHASVVRVEGLESMRRIEGTVKVSAEDIAKVQRYLVEMEALRRKREPAFAKVSEIPRSKNVDGVDSDWSGGGLFVVDKVWNHVKSDYDVLVDAGMSYDSRNLYLIVRVHDDPSPMRNAADSPALLFKGGDAVDLQLRTAAAAGEKSVMPGDVRVLMSFIDKRPVVMLYRYRVPGTPEAKSQKFASPWRHERVDVVEQLTDVRVAWRENGRGYVLEAAIPLKRLGLELRPHTRFSGDVGVLYSDQAGVSTVNRVYWSNKANHITSDVPSEVMLHPATWGHFLCVGRSKTDVDSLSDNLLGPEDKELKDLLE